MKSFGLMVLSLLAVGAIAPGMANADTCEGCWNFQGEQYCNPFEPTYRYEVCVVIGGFCQMWEQCDPVMAYNDLNVNERVGPGGNYLPLSRKNVLREGRLYNECTGFLVAEEDFEDVPDVIEI